MGLGWVVFADCSLWNNGLTNPPWTGNVQVDANLTAFRDYYYRQWLPNRERVQLWNHYERDGPRTANHAEAYHRGLSSVFDTRRRLPLGKASGAGDSAKNLG